MSLETAIQEARRAINADPISARLGYGNGDIYDKSVPGNYWVKKIEANGSLSKPLSLPVNPLANIPVKDGNGVILGYDIFGTFCIYSANPLAMLSGGVSPLILNPLDSAVYGKTSQTNLATLYYQRHADTVNFPFRVIVFKAPVIINGIADFFAGAGIDVDSFVPSAGFKCYASVFLRTDMTLEAFASTPINLGDPLLVSRDIQECIDQSSANSVIICAWELRGGDTVLSPAPERNVDMRQIVNTSSGGSGTVTDVTATSPLSSTGGVTPDISHDASGVTPDSYTNANITVDAEGHVTAASSGGGAAGDYILLQDQKSQNTSGGTFSSGGWQTRDLNTIVVDTTGAVSLSSNQFTLPAGTYRVIASAPAYKVDRHQSRLYNISDSTVISLGTSEVSQSGTFNQTRSLIMMRFTIASTKTFEIQHQCQTGAATSGFGVEANFAGEIYTTIELIKE